MIKIIWYFILIRLRKLFGKVDFSVYLTVLLFLVITDYILLQYTKEYHLYFLLFSLDILVRHLKREDYDLLRYKKHFKHIFYVEYSIYSLPFTIPLALSKQWVSFLLYQLVLLLYLHLPSYKARLYKYPFKLFDPFWVICFRKYKLFLVWIAVALFIILGLLYDNNNLILFAILMVAFTLSIPSFYREKIYFIKVNKSKNYLIEQFKTAIYNSLFLLIPTGIIIFISGNFALLKWVPLLIIPVMINILIKYSFFNRPLQQQLVYVIILAGFDHFLPFVAIPLLIYSGHKNLKKLKS